MVEFTLVACRRFRSRNNPIRGHKSIRAIDERALRPRASPRFDSVRLLAIFVLGRLQRPLQHRQCLGARPSLQHLPLSAVNHAIFITFNPDPLWVGLAGPVGGRDTVVIQLDINVDATGALHGSITKVHRMLRDRDTGQILADVISSGPFPYTGNTPCRSYDPLLLYGHENLTDAVVVVSRERSPRVSATPAILSVDVTI